jgi:hypothetical protein
MHGDLRIKKISTLYNNVSIYFRNLIKDKTKLLKLVIPYSRLGRTAAPTRLNTKFRGLAPSPSSGKTDLPDQLY